MLWAGRRIARLFPRTCAGAPALPARIDLIAAWQMGIAAGCAQVRQVDDLEEGLMQEAQRFFVLTQTDNLWKEHLQVGSLPSWVAARAREGTYVMVTASSSACLWLEHTPGLAAGGLAQAAGA